MLTLLGTGRLVMRLSVNRTAMSPDFVANSYSPLKSELPQVPEVVVQAALPVLEHIGVSRVSSPTDAVRAMITHFRGFVASTQHLSELSGRELYQRLALSRKGVCRHWAYAFVVTALALGIPARMVHNEAHAWSEAYDGRSWHRIDLGGAASSFRFDGEKPTGPPYRMPVDHYEWPASATPAAQSRTDASEGQSHATVETGQTTPAAPGSAQPPAATQSDLPAPHQTPAATSTAASDSAPSNTQARSDATSAPSALVEQKALSTSTHVSFILKGQSTVHRGDTVTLEGDARSETGGCVKTRVDFDLRRGTNKYSLGAAVTDGRGHFTLQTTVPLSVGVGPYEVTATASQAEECDNSFW